MLTEIRDDVRAMRHAFDSLARTVSVLAEDTRSFGRMIAILAEEQAKGVRMFDDRLTLVSRSVAEASERLSSVLADQARARTTDLERWMQFEERLRRSEKP